MALNVVLHNCTRSRRLAGVYGYCIHLSPIKRWFCRLAYELPVQFFSFK